MNNMAGNDEYQQKQFFNSNGLEEQINLAARGTKLKELTIQDIIDFIEILNKKQNDKRKDNKQELL